MNAGRLTSFAVGVLAVACGLDAVGSAPGPRELRDAGDIGDAGADAGGDGADATCRDPALAFDGVDDVATVPGSAELDLPGAFTVEAWVRPGPRVASGGELVVLSKHDPDRGSGWLLRIKDRRVQCVLYGTDGLSTVIVTAGNAPTNYAVLPDRWEHIAAALEGSELRVYYAGQVRDKQQLGLAFTRVAFEGDLHIGRAASSSVGHFEGQLDDVRLSRVARYGSTAGARPIRPLAPDADTVALFHFDEPNGASLEDASPAARAGALGASSAAPTRVAAPCVHER